MRIMIWLSHLVALALLILLPIVFADIMAASLAKLHLSHSAAVQLMIGIILGGFINIPIVRIEQPEDVPVRPLAIFGLDQALPEVTRMRRQTIIAVNLGGCVIPFGLVLYELIYLAHLGVTFLAPVFIACIVTVVVCYFFAQPLPGVGIVMPGFIPPLAAIMTALLLAPTEAPATAFIAGVLGPLIGADLLHLRSITKVATTGVASIGGAGTFDGIVLSGILAAYLA